jgi:hypothetical protein
MDRLKLIIDSLSAPKRCGSINYQQVKTTEKDPFATFVFYYRSTGALKGLNSS